RTAAVWTLAAVHESRDRWLHSLAFVQQKRLSHVAVSRSCSFWPPIFGSVSNCGCTLRAAARSKAGTLQRAVIPQEIGQCIILSRCSSTSCERKKREHRKSIT